MRVILFNMAINLRQHGAVCMAHESCDGQMVMPLDKLAGAEAMPGSIAEQALAYYFREPVEAVANGILCPRLIAVIEKQLGLSLGLHEPLNDGQRWALQIDNPLGALSLRFGGRKYNTLVLKVHVAALNMANFLRSTASIPDEGNEIMKRVTFIQPQQHAFKIGLRHVYFAALGRGLFELLDGIAINITKLFAPIKDALNRYNSAAFIVISPLFTVGINPFHNLKRLQVQGNGICNARMGIKLTQIALIPFMGAGRLMALTPSQVFFAKSIKCNRTSHAFDDIKTWYISTLAGESY